MTEIESLILAVETRGYSEADKALAGLERSAGAAEGAVKDFNDASRATAAATRTAATATSAATAAQATHTASTTASTVATRASLLARIGATLATARNTVATAAATAANAAYTASMRVLGGVIGFVRTAATSLYTQLALFVGPVLAATAIIGATKAWQGYEAQLKISTGSAEKAKVAFEAVQDFASTTPFSVGEATNAFIKLVNLGLTPSEQALRSYGNTASSMGKSLQDMIEAVADAATNEFERLKEFGIKASKQGDQVTFTFQGVKTTVAATAAEIEKFLIGIGEKQFAGAMAEQAKTLTGVLSNLGDEWDKLLQNISRGGLGDAITQGFAQLSSVLAEFNAQLASGQTAAEIKAFAMKWEFAIDSVVTTFQAATDLVGGVTTLWGVFGEEATQQMEVAWDHLPLEAERIVNLVAEEFALLINKASVVADAFVEEFKIKWDGLVEIAKATGSLIADAFTFSGTDAATANIAAIVEKNEKAIVDLHAKTEAQLKTFDSISAANVETIERDTSKAIASYDEQLVKAQQLRAQYDADKAARAAENEDRLAQFKIGGDGGSAATGGLGTGLSAKINEEQKAFEQHLQFLEEGLEQEGQVIAASYEAQKEQILAATNLTNQEKQTLVLTALSESLISEEENIRQSYDQRREMILSATGITENARTALLTRLTQAREKQLTAIELATQRERLNAASTFFGNLASIGSVFGEKGFKIAKAAAIAQAVIKTYEAATSAYASLAGIPYVGPVLGAAAAAAAIAAGAANIAVIKSQQYNPGAYEHGGMIPAGRYGIVGEAGPELISGPAVVTSAATTASKNIGGNGEVRTVVIHNFGPPMEADSQLEEDRLRVVLKPMLEENKRRTKQELAGEVARGGTEFTRNAEEAWGLKRGGI